MSVSNVCQFPMSPSLPSPYVHDAPSHNRKRPRALSLLSVRSGNSVKLNLEPPKAEPTILTSNSSKQHMACGSFVLNASAAATLQTFFTPVITHPKGRSTYTYSHYEKDDKPQSPTSSIPSITRTLPLSSGSRSPSPANAYPTHSKARKIPRTRTRSEVHPSDLHPILAGLEQRSRFYVKKSSCATCKRSGSGFPQCAKCGECWCSRECRLKGGRKHACKAAPA